MRGDLGLQGDLGIEDQFLQQIEREGNLRALFCRFQDVFRNLLSFQQSSWTHFIPLHTEKIQLQKESNPRTEPTTQRTLPFQQWVGPLPRLPALVSGQLPWFGINYTNRRPQVPTLTCFCSAHLAVWIIQTLLRCFHHFILDPWTSNWTQRYLFKQFTLITFFFFCWQEDDISEYKKKCTIQKYQREEVEEDGRGGRRGDRQPPHKYIKNSLDTASAPYSRRPQASRGASWAPGNEKSNQYYKAIINQFKINKYNFKKISEKQMDGRTERIMNVVAPMSDITRSSLHNREIKLSRLSRWQARSNSQFFLFLVIKCALHH